MKMAIYLKLTWSIPFYTQQSKSVAIKQALVQSETVSIFFHCWIIHHIKMNSWNRSTNVWVEIFFHTSLVFALVRFLSSATPIYRQDLLLCASSELFHHHPLFRYLLRNVFTFGRAKRSGSDRECKYFPILGFHMTSSKFKLRNCRLFWVSSFMWY